MNWISKIYSLPNWLVFLGIVSLYVLFGMMLFHLFCKRIHARYRISEETNNVVSGVMAAAGVLYGLLLGLVAVNNWDNFVAARKLCSNEAATISAFYRDVMVLNHAYTNRLKQDAKNYLEDIIAKEFTGYARGEVKIDYYHLLDQMHRDLVSYGATNPTTDPFFIAAIDKFNKIVEYRTLRVESVLNDGVPSVYWLVIILGSCTVLFLSLFFHMSSAKGHLVLMNCLSFLIGIMVFLILVVDNPYRGTVSVDSRAYQDVLERIDLL